MSRILTQLTVVNFLAMGLAFGTGGLSWWRGGLLNVGDSSYMWHLGLGLFAVIFNLGLHSLIFIYLLGTGRWVKEVALAYKIPDEPLPRETREIKRKTFPPALFAMLVPITVAVAGMANAQRRGDWAAPLHFVLAICALLINVWAFRIERRNVTLNVQVIDKVMSEVERIRAAAGLPTNEEAWQQQEQG